MTTFNNQLVKIVKPATAENKMTVVRASKSAEALVVGNTFEIDLKDNDFNVDEMIEISGTQDGDKITVTEVHPDDGTFGVKFSNVGVREVDEVTSTKPIPKSKPQKSENSNAKKDRDSQTADKIEEEFINEVNKIIKRYEENLDEAFDLNRIQYFSDVLIAIETDINENEILSGNEEEAIKLVNRYLSEQSGSMVINKTDRERLENVHTGITNSSFRVPIFPERFNTARSLHEAELSDDQEGVALGHISEELMTQLSEAYKIDEDHEAQPELFNEARTESDNKQADVYNEFSSLYKTLKTLDNGNSVSVLRNMDTVLNGNIADHKKIFKMVGKNIDHKTFNLRTYEDCLFLEDIYGDEYQNLKFRPLALEATYGVPEISEIFDEIIEIEEFARAYRTGAKLPDISEELQYPTERFIKEKLNEYNKKIKSLGMQKGVDNSLNNKIEDSFEYVQTLINDIKNSKKFKEYSVIRGAADGTTDYLSSVKSKMHISDSDLDYFDTLHRATLPSQDITVSLTTQIKEHKSAYPLDQLFSSIEEVDSERAIEISKAGNIIEVMDIINKSDIRHSLDTKAINKYISKLSEEAKLAPLPRSKEGQVISPAIQEHMEQHIFRPYANDVLPALSYQETKEYTEDLAMRMSTLPSHTNSKIANFVGHVPDSPVKKMLDRVNRKYLEHISKFCSDSEKKFLTALSEDNYDAILKGYDIKKMDSVLKSISDKIDLEVSGGNKELDLEIIDNLRDRLTDLVKDKLADFTLVNTSLDKENENREIKVLLNRDGDSYQGMSRKEIFVREYISSKGSPLFGKRREEILALLNRGALSISGIDKNSPFYPVIMSEIKKAVKSFPSDQIRHADDRNSDDYQFSLLDYTDEEDDVVLNKIAEYNSKDLLEFYCNNGVKPAILDEEDINSRRAHRVMERDAYAFGNIPKKLQLTAAEDEKGSLISSYSDHGYLYGVLTKDYKDWNHEELLQFYQNKDNQLTDEVIAKFIADLKLDPAKSQEAFNRINFVRRALNNISNNILSHNRIDHSKQIVVDRSRDVYEKQLRIQDEKAQFEKEQKEKQGAYDKKRDSLDFAKRISVLDPTVEGFDTILHKELMRSVRINADADGAFINSCMYSASPKLAVIAKPAMGIVRSSALGFTGGFKVGIGKSPMNTPAEVVKQAAVNGYKKSIGALPYAEFAPKFIKEIQVEAEQAQVKRLKQPLDAALDKHSEYIEQKYLNAEIINETVNIGRVSQINTPGAIDAARAISPAVRDTDEFKHIMSSSSDNLVDEFMANSGFPFFKNDINDKNGILKKSTPVEIAAVYRKYKKKEEERVRNIKRSFVLSELKELKILNEENLTTPGRIVKALEFLKDKDLFKTSEVYSIMTEFLNEVPDPSVEIDMNKLVDMEIDKVRNGDRGESTTKTNDFVSFNINSEKGYFVIRKVGNKVVFSPPTYKNEDGQEQDFTIQDITLTQLTRLINNSNGKSDFEDEEYISDPIPLLRTIRNNSIEMSNGASINIEDLTENEVFEQISSSLHGEYQGNKEAIRDLPKNPAKQEEVRIVCDLSGVDYDKYLEYLENPKSKDISQTQQPQSTQYQETTVNMSQYPTHSISM